MKRHGLDLMACYVSYISPFNQVMHLRDGKETYGA
jgi:hypothetical protein